MAKIHLLQLLMFLAAFSLGHSQNATMFGSCNVTTLQGGAFKCQRITFEKIKSLNRTCSHVEDDQEKCINAHVDSCMTNTSDAFLMSYTKDLLKLMTFSCHKLRGYRVDDRLLGIKLKCNTSNTDANNMFKRLTDCYTNVSTTLGSNPHDPALCGSYKTAKQCISNEIMGYCPNFHADQDGCNVFCASGTDNNKPCPALPTTFTCNSATALYMKTRNCQNRMVIRLQEGRPCNTEVQEYSTCLGDELDSCWKPIPDPNEFTTLKNLVTSVSWSKRFFCETTPYDITGLSARMKQFIPGCTNDFFTKADQCGEELRKTFTANKKDKKLGRMYAEAKQCYFKALDQNCPGFPKELKESLVEDVKANPFCAGGKDCATGGSAGSGLLSVVTFFSSLLPILVSMFML